MLYIPTVLYTALASHILLYPRARTIVLLTANGANGWKPFGDFYYSFKRV